MRELFHPFRLVLPCRSSAGLLEHFLSMAVSPPLLPMSLTRLPRDMLTNCSWVRWGWWLWGLVVWARLALLVGLGHGFALLPLALLPAWPCTGR